MWKPGTRTSQSGNEIDLHKAGKKSNSFWKPPAVGTVARPIKAQVATAVTWPSSTHRPSLSIIPMAKSTTAQAGMLFENGMGNGNINPRLAITMPKPISRSILAQCDLLQVILGDLFENWKDAGMQAKPSTRCRPFFDHALFTTRLVGPRSMRCGGGFVAITLRIIDNLPINRNSVASLGALITPDAFVVSRYADFVGLDTIIRLRRIWRHRLFRLVQGST